MNISRREFVGSSAVCISGLGLSGFAGLARKTECAVFDLQANCALPESIQGYSLALGVGTVCSSADLRTWQRSCRLAIIPGAGIIDAATASGLVTLLEAGTNILLESGAGFLDSGESAAQHETLRTFFDADVAAPVNVWSERGLIPYVHYNWPRQLIVRDFSRAIPVSAPRAEVIGRVSSLPVAVKKRVGNGLLIFLGSPLGPALRAGDPEAREWLRCLASTI